MLTRDGNIDYEGLVGEAVREAWRNVVRTILTDIAKNGLRGEHHYFISFYTTAPGVSVSRRLLEKYATEMTIVLQHKFWDLTVLPDRFEVKLAFNGIPERLVVPYSALKVFFDPSARFGHQFDDPDQIADASVDEPETGRATGGRPRAVGGGARSDKKRPTSSARKRPEIVSDEPLPDQPSPATPATDAPVAAVAPDVTPPSPPPAPITDSPKVVSLDQFRKK